MVLFYPPPSLTHILYLHPCRTNSFSSLLACNHLMTIDETEPVCALLLCAWAFLVFQDSAYLEVPSHTYLGFFFHTLLVSLQHFHVHDVFSCRGWLHHWFVARVEVYSTVVQPFFSVSSQWPLARRGFLRALFASNVNLSVFIMFNRNVHACMSS